MAADQSEDDQDIGQLDPDSADAGKEEEEEEGGDDALEGGWQDKEERSRLLSKCQPGTDDQERLEALIGIRDKAMEVDNWEPLWADSQVRAALLACADPPDPDFGKNVFAEEEPEPPSDFVRTLAVSIMICLAASVANRSAMAENPSVRHALVGNADDDRSARLRERVFLALCSLVLAGACADPSDDHIPSRPPTPKKCEVCGLIPCVCSVGEKVWRNSDMDVCHALMLGAASGLPVGVRVGVLGTLASLALSSVVDPALVWGNRKVRAGLALAASATEPEEVRLHALEALWAFSACDLVQERMWREKPVRQALLKAAERAVKGDGEEEIQQSEGLRCRALSALANLASSINNRTPMWRDRRLTASVLQAVSAGGALRADALSVLVQLTKQWTNCASMVAAGVLDLLAAAVDDKVLRSDERRNCGFARDRLQEAVDAATSGPFQP